MAAIIGLLVLLTYPLGVVVGCALDPEGALRVCSDNCGDVLEESDSGTVASHNWTSPRCDCSQMCPEFGECCFNSAEKRAALGEHYDFVCASRAGVERYRAVTTCPHDKIHDMCKISMGEYVPVTSGVTGITYGNFFCASCNNDHQDLVMWEVIKCIPPVQPSNRSLSGPTYVSRDQTKGYFRLRLGKRIGGGVCQFHVRGRKASFSKQVELRPCSTTPMISVCATSWDNDSVEEKCWSYTNPVHHHGIVFKNPHCAECNFVNLSYVQCEPHPKWSKIRSAVKKKRSLDPRTTRANSGEEESERKSSKPEGDPYAFSELIRINATECTPPAGSACCAGERYDYRTKKCRKIRQWMERDSI